MRKNHKKMMACVGMSVMLAASMLQGCGGGKVDVPGGATEAASGDKAQSKEEKGPSKEDLLADMKEFATPDGTASIHLKSNWDTEDMGVDFWLGAQSKNGADAAILMQFPKAGITLPVDSMESMKEMIVSSYGVSDQADVQAPEIPGLKNISAQTCTISADGQKGDAYVAYGETDYAFYAIMFADHNGIDDDAIASIHASLSSFHEEPAEVEDSFTAEITDTIRWFNASYAILTAVNGWDTSRFGGLPANDQSMELQKQLLEEWWGVTDRASADENLEWILAEGHRADFAENMGLLADAGLGSVPEEERVDFIKENFGMTDEEAPIYVDSFALYEEKGADALAGWDYCRALSLMGYYYLSGYYTEEEALDKSLEISQTLQPMFQSWDELVDSYLAGYEYWSEESSQERRAIYEELKGQEENPYAVDYQTALEKTW